jgi:hypothetical protein
MYTATLLKTHAPLDVMWARVAAPQIGNITRLPGGRQEYLP